MKFPDASVSSLRRLPGAVAAPALLAASLLAPAAQATILLDSSPVVPTTMAGTALSPTQFNNGFQFTTDASGYALESLTLRLFNTTPGPQTQQHQLVLIPFSDLTDRQTLSFETTLLGDTVATADSVTLSLSGWTLQPSTRYLIGFLGDEGMEVVTGRQPIAALVLAPGWAAGPAVREVGGTVATYATVASNWLVYPDVALAGEATAPIPEPAAFWLSLAGVGLLGWRLRATSRGHCTA